MRVATIDIGTNTVLLLIAQRGEDGCPRAVAERATITRLGEGVDRTRQLSARAIARTTACLDEYAQIIQAHAVDRVAVVGTSAMRDAGGGASVAAHVRAALGVDARVLSGDEEARLTFRGAVSGLPQSPDSDVAVFDIGGGSTEIVIGRATEPDRLTYAHSFDVGSVRLTERFVVCDPPSTEERQRIVEAVRGSLAGIPPIPRDAAPIGVAGTMTTLAAVSLQLARYDGARVHGHVMQADELARVVDRLAACDVAARRSLPGMEPKRADVIVAGGVLAVTLLQQWSAQDVVISDRGVRWGLAEELLELTPHGEG